MIDSIHQAVEDSGRKWSAQGLRSLALHLAMAGRITGQIQIEALRFAVKESHRGLVKPSRGGPGRR